MAIVVLANGSMRKMEDSVCDHPSFEHAGRKQLVTIGEVSGYFQNVLAEKGLIEIGVYNPDEPAPSINDLLNQGLKAPAPEPFSWIAAMHDAMERI